MSDISSLDIYLKYLIFLIPAASAAFIIYLLIKDNKIKFNNSSPALQSFVTDFTELSRKNLIDPVIGRKKEISQLITILNRRTKNNAVLVGKAGIGKTTIVEGLAQSIVSKNVPPNLYEKRILSLDINSLIAGTKYRGEFEERVKKITEEIRNSNRKIILFIDEAHNLVRAESSGESISLGDIFKPAMANGQLQIIGATTPEEYDLYFSKDQAFKRRLQTIFVAEPDEKETLRILSGIRSKYEAFHNVKITDEALAACIAKSKKIKSKSFPDKAIDLMDEAASNKQIEYINITSKNSPPKKLNVTVEDVNKVFIAYSKE